jgi:signal transduction histidine kinase
VTWLRRLAVRARRAPLGFKLRVLTGVVTAGVITAPFVALSVHTRASVKRLLQEELGRNQRTLINLQRANLQHLIAAASLLTQSPSIRSALPEPATGARDRAQLARTADVVLRKLLPSLNEDVVLVTDDEGRVFASATLRNATAPSRGTDLSRVAAVQRAIDPAAPADRGELAVLAHNGVLYQVGVHPLVLDGFTLGSIILGSRLDSGFVAAAQAAFVGEVLLTIADSVVAGSLPGATLSAVSEDYVLAPLVLGELTTGESVRLWLLAPLTQTVREITRPLLYDFLFFGTLAVVIASVGAAFMARSVLGPLDRFVAYLGSGAETPFDADNAAAEVRTLSASFEALMQSIAGKQRQLEAQTAALRESEAQLRHSQKMEAIGTLAGGIAHDFHNFLNIISGYSRVALADAEAEGRKAAAEDLTQVVAAADRASKLTDQLLAFSRKQVTQPEILDLGEVVDAIAPMFSRVIGRNIELRVVRAVVLSSIVAERGQIEQVLMNLIVNARDAMPDGGVITVTTANVDEERGVALSVSDTGTGMSQAVCERIFEPFFTTKEVGKGTGLGLSTVYGIVNQSGGAISVESVLGEGTTFRMTFPAAAAALAHEDTIAAD